VTRRQKNFLSGLILSAFAFFFLYKYGEDQECSSCGRNVQVKILEKKIPISSRVRKKEVTLMYNGKKYWCEINDSTFLNLHPDDIISLNYSSVNDTFCDTQISSNENLIGTFFCGVVGLLLFLDVIFMFLPSWLVG
jgi:hypothetical protein